MVAVPVSAGRAEGPIRESSESDVFILRSSTRKKKNSSARPSCFLYLLYFTLIISRSATNLLETNHTQPTFLRGHVWHVTNWPIRHHQRREVRHWIIWSWVSWQSSNWKEFELENRVSLRQVTPTLPRVLSQTTTRTRTTILTWAILPVQTSIECLPDF